MTIEFTLPDISCGHCAKAVEKTIKRLDANAAVTVDITTKRVQVETTAARDALSAALTEEGYPPA
jgi:copper chaperone